MPETIAPASTTAPAWQLDWLTPARCRVILGLFLTVTFFGRLYYLHHCPIDLGGDEAQYWDWSRNLDLSYYSKGPAIAYIIRASCAIFGDTMPAVRYPAIVINLGTSLVTYLLVRKLFASERLALGTVLLFALVPIVIVGGVLMTIDPPMFFCWALATYLAAIAIFDQKRWPWPLVGIVIGVGFLAKYIALVWFVGLFGYLLFNSRRQLSRAIGALAISLLFTLPVLIWNHQHDWVSFRHVAQQTGTTGGSFSLMNVLEFAMGQIGALGPAAAWIMIAALVHACWPSSSESQQDPHPDPLPDYRERGPRSRLLFLTWIGLPLFLINLLWSVRTKIQLNWPAPAFFTLLVLAAHFLGTRLQNGASWKPWRGWFWGMVATGLIVIPIVHDTSFLLPAIENVVKRARPKADDFDPLARLRGWRTLGEHISQELKTLGTGAFVLCDDYQQTAETAFYVEGQPKTYCAGSYFGKRMSQYDIWPDRRLDAASPLVGHDAIYVGKGGGMPEVIQAAFAKVERLPFLEIMVNGVKIKQFTTWRCYGFKGMNRTETVTDY